MREVFSEALQDALERSLSAAFWVFVGEVRDLPAAALHAHQSAKPLSRVRPGWKPLSIQETALALFAFLLPITLVGVNLGCSGLRSVWVIIALVLAFAILGVGLWRGLPRWSLPYLSLAISLAGYFVLFEWVADLVSPLLISRLTPGDWQGDELLLLQAFWAGFLWLGLFAFTFLVIGLLVLVRRFRSLYWRIRQDWTLASFILYGEAVLALIVLFDGYSRQEPYFIASFMLLAGGAWMYLRSPVPWQRVLSLVGALSFSMWVVAFSKWLPVTQRWSDWFQSASLQVERSYEARRVLVEWGWLVLVLLLPTLFAMFPDKKRLSLQDQPLKPECGPPC
ncbi:MAG: hypothetical protein AB1894_19625 [Chloroflexota bacterium]